MADWANSMPDTAPAFSCAVVRAFRSCHYARRLLPAPVALTDLNNLPRQDRLPRLRAQPRFNDNVRIAADPDASGGG